MADTKFDLSSLGLADIFSDESKCTTQVTTPVNMVETIPDTVGDAPKKKRGRKKKEETEEENELTFMQSNKAYIDSYQEQNDALKGILFEIDMDQQALSVDLDKIRKAKTMSKKYDYISSLATTKANLYSNKIAIIREMDSNLTQAHNLELKRQKELNLATNNVDDSKQVLDFYKTIINSPSQELPPFMKERDLFSDVNSVNGVFTTHRELPTEITPAQNMMLLDSNPDIHTVVKYDPNTGNKWFDVINVRSGASIPNVDLPSEFRLNNITLDTMNMVANDTKLNITYPLVLVNSPIGF